MVGGLSSEEERIVQTFANRLRKQFPEEVRDVLLFGSKARGDHHVDSDVDILVIALSDDWRLHDRIRQVGYELDESIDHRLSIQVISETRFEYARERHFQFATSVLEEGVRV
jgi:predicted nucleotidyltransferase